MPRKRRHRSRQDISEVSCCIKYLMFGFNVVFLIIGSGLFVIGLWAWAEKDVFKNFSEITNVTLDPALFFVIVGVMMLSMSFTGCIGALRENTGFLFLFMLSLALMLILEIIIGILGFVYKSWVRDQIESQVKKMIINYRDDLDLKNLVDWVQRDWLHCCGVQSYKDWEFNIYFNCTSPGVEACGVPFSCCKYSQEAVLINRHCGYGIMRTDREIDRGTNIYVTGCIPAGERWLESNLMLVSGVAIGVSLLQILGVCFAHNLRGDIQAQRAKWTL